MPPTQETQLEMITLTPPAVQAVRELLSQRKLTGHALRVFVSGGGCSGLQYGMALEPSVRERPLLRGTRVRPQAPFVRQSIS